MRTLGPLAFPWAGPMSPKESNLSFLHRTGDKFKLITVVSDCVNICIVLMFSKVEELFVTCHLYILIPKILGVLH